MDYKIKRVKVVHGHVSADTAYVVDDYPYGRERTQIRYWVETADKGAAKGRQRFMAQTLNPKTGRWNAPKADTYGDLVLMFLDPQDDGRDFVRQWKIDTAWIYPAGWHRARLAGVYEQMTDGQRRAYDLWVRCSRKVNPITWGDWDAAIVKLAAYIREHGTEPELVNQVWTMPDGQRRHIGDHEAATYFTVARELAASAPDVDVDDTAAADPDDDDVVDVADLAAQLDALSDALAAEVSPVRIERHRSSVTQGEVSVWYGDDLVGRLGDKIVLCEDGSNGSDPHDHGDGTSCFGGFHGHPDAYWVDVAERWAATEV